MGSLADRIGTSQERLSELEARKLESDGWQKCPSVYSGGKPYFFYRRNPDTDEREWVIWDRAIRSWRFDYDD